jgi:hypothetical protein
LSSMLTAKIAGQHLHGMDSKRRREQHQT